MKEYLADVTGTHALEHVVAITPNVVEKDRDGKPVRTLATLHMAGGQFFHTATDYPEALKAWGAGEAAPPQPK